MNTGWILIGGAVLLLLLNRRPSPATASAPRMPETGTPAPASGTGQPAADAAGAMPESVGVAPPDEVLEQAAIDPAKASLAGEWRVSWHGWNYYRAQAAIKAGLCAPPCSEYAPVLGERVGLTDNQGITASEYHGYLSQIGMSGVAWRRVAAYRRPWQ
jgi:hypothetical protein